MTVKEAIVKVLEENKGSFTYLQVHDLIIDKDYIDWSNAKTPTDTVGAQLGEFIRKNDSRVKRIKGKNGYEYYLSIYENELNLAPAGARLHRVSTITMVIFYNLSATDKNKVMIVNSQCIKFQETTRYNRAGAEASKTCTTLILAVVVHLKN